jgi:hypothetical protein
MNRNTSSINEWSVAAARGIARSNREKYAASPSIMFNQTYNLQTRIAQGRSGRFRAANSSPAFEPCPNLRLGRFLVFLAFLLVAFGDFTVCLAAPISIQPKPGILPIWSGWKQIPDSGFPFLTNVGCSATSYGSQKLYVAAQRASDNTLWLNSASGDPTTEPWDGWRPAPKLPNGAYAKTGYSPSISYYSDQSTGTFCVDLVAVGIHGGWDLGVYINSLDIYTGYWSGWSQVPGSFGSNTGVSILARRLCARGFLIGPGILNGGVYVTFYQGTNTAPWHLVNGFIANAQPCPTLTFDGVGGLYASQASDQQLYSLQHLSLPFNGSLDLWAPLPFQPLTDAKAAGPLPNMSTSIFSLFVKGIGDHQVRGLRSSGLQLIPGNKLTDAGLESCAVLNPATHTYQNMLFVKDIGDHKIYFNSFKSVAPSP